MAADEYEVKYRVIALNPAKDAGKKLLREENRLWLIQELQRLKYWPDNEDEFDYEKAFGAIEFKFRIEDKWIRIFVYEDNTRKVMWVLRAYAKKTNQLTVAQRIGVETAVSRIEQEIKLYEKQQKQLDRRSQLRVLQGGREPS